MTTFVLFFGFAVFLFGLIVGSFLNVCIYRLPREESLVYPPSHCPNCYQPIRWEDNIPIISWLMLKRRCRGCGLGISFIYPAVELFTGLLFVLYYWQFVGVHFAVMPTLLAHREVLYYGALYLVQMGFICGLFVATVIDFRFLIIPDCISLPGVVLGLVFCLVFPEMHPHSLAGAHPHLSSLLSGAIGAAVGAGIIYGIGAVGKAVLAKDAMGFGDVKLMAMIGAFLGWQLTIFVLLLSAVLGTIYGGIHLARTGNSRIPYGPFLSAAAVVAIVFRPAIQSFLADMIATYRILLS